MELELREYSSVLTKEQCERFIHLFGSRVTRSSVLGAGGTRAQSSARTSSSVKIPNGDFPVDIWDALSRLVSIHCSKPIVHQECWEIIHYAVGQEFRAHHDLITNPGSSGQRLFTALICLQAPEAGGETVFPLAKREIIPVQGTLVIWRNMRSDGVAYNKLTQHAAKPVLKGEKWSLITWVREHPYSPLRRRINA
jgi:prolyl 4-hydroxylase